jgi:hypothetical protein
MPGSTQAADTPTLQPVIPDVPVTPVTPAAVAPVEAKKEEPAPVTPTEEEDDAPAAGDDFTKNFRVHTNDAKASAFLKAYKAALAVNPNANPAVIAAGIGYDLPVEEKGTASGEPAKGAAPEIPGNDPLSVMQARITEIRATLKQAGSDEKLYDSEVQELSDELTELVSEVKAMKVEQKILATLDQRSAHDKALTARQSVKAQVLQEWPTANDDESVLGEEIKLLLGDVTNNPSHPLHAQMGQDNFPAVLTAKAVESKTAKLQKQFGYTKEQALAAIKGKPVAEATSPVTPATPPQKTPAPVPRTILTTTPGGSSAPEAVAINPAQVLEQLENNPQLRRTVLFGSGTVQF